MWLGHRQLFEKRKKATTATLTHADCSLITQFEYDSIAVFHIFECFILSNEPHIRADDNDKSGGEKKACCCVHGIRGPQMMTACQSIDFTARLMRLDTFQNLSSLIISSKRDKEIERTVQLHSSCMMARGWGRYVCMCSIFS